MDFKKGKVKIVTLKEKASLNAPLFFAIFASSNHINYILHLHIEKEGIPSTDFPYTPGTKEYVRSVLELLKNNSLVGIKNHGIICVAKNKEDLLRRLNELL